MLKMLEFYLKPFSIRLMLYHSDLLLDLNWRYVKLGLTSSELPVCAFRSITLKKLKRIGSKLVKPS